MERILEAAMKAKSGGGVVRDSPVGSAEGGGAMGGHAVGGGAVGAGAVGAGTVGASVLGGAEAANKLVEKLKTMNLVQGPDLPEVKLTCKCTRKCKTKLCPCFLEGYACNPKCHSTNNSCTNL